MALSPRDSPAVLQLLELVICEVALRDAHGVEDSTGVPAGRSILASARGKHAGRRPGAHQGVTTGSQPLQCHSASPAVDILSAWEHSSVPFSPPYPAGTVEEPHTFLTSTRVLLMTTQYSLGWEDPAVGGSAPWRVAIRELVVGEDGVHVSGAWHLNVLQSPDLHPAHEEELDCKEG